MVDNGHSQDTGRRRPDDHLLDEAAEWIGRLRAADVDAADRQAFSRWLTRSPAHRSAFDTMADLWDGLGVIGAVDAPATAGVTAPGIRPRAPAARRRHTWALPITALAALLVITVAVLLSDRGVQYRTAPGEQQVVHLGDGSTMTLNTNTSVRVRFSSDSRRVELAPGGEAFFEVAHDPQRPFVVDSVHGTARAVGTAFSVHAEEQRTLIEVTRGIVAVRPHSANGGTEGDEEVKVPAGKEASISAGVASGTVRPLEPDHLSWRDGQLVYDDVPLGQLIDDLNRYMPRRMTISSPELAQTRVSAVLAIADQTTTLQALAEVLPLKWVQVSDTLVIIHPA